jgi:predicted enzyme related to lactoylglutathione lyase
LDGIYKNGVILNNLNMIIGCLKLKTIKEIQV